MQKGYQCYCPSLNWYLVSADVTFLEHTPFSSSSDLPSQGEEDDLLVYTITSSPSAPLKPPIIHTYSRRPQPLVPDVAPIPDPSASCPDEPVPSSSDPPLSYDLPITLRKGKHT